ncbi:MAG: redoxin domain-containing protein, partial [Bacteroidales bacterium]|nr:redoxin domain-containing protein [Bacteroidales bacterium]
MKKILLAVSSLLLVASCSQQPSYVINGEIAGAEGKAVLSFKNPVSKTEVSDTVAIENGKFVFKGSAEDVVPGKIVILAENDDPATAHICVENAALNVKMDWANVKRNPRRGSVITDVVTEGGVNNAFKKEYAAIPEKVMAQEKYAGYVAAKNKVNEESANDPKKFMDLHIEFMKEFGAVSEEIEKETKQAKIDFIKANPAVESAADEYSKMSLGKASLEELEEVFNAFTPQVQNCAMAQGLKKEIEVLKSIQPGAVAPDFTLETIGGEEFVLSSLRGKYVVLDFWASWCGPCRASIPGIKKVYEQYKDKGVEIVGI